MTAPIWSYYPDLLEKPVPRYTSYPTAAEFGTGTGAADLDAELRQVQGAVSLYLHIPFCEQICWYCGRNTAANNKAHRLSGYLDALHREIALVGVRLEYCVAVRRIAFGGGSPNAVAPTDFVRLVDALTLHMPLEEPDWSIELDPRGLSEEWGAVLAAVGVRYASLGVQTFNGTLQAAIGRIQPDADLVRAVDLLRRNGIRSLNFDLMYGLPGQSLAQLEATLQRTVELGADRIALFGYAHVPKLLPRQRRIDASQLPDQAARFAMASFGYEYLTAAGYVPFGFDHFAQRSDPLAEAVRAGRLRRNFQGFTDDFATTLIGLGASVISNFPDLLILNEKNAGRYRMLLSQDHLPAAQGMRRSPNDQRRAAVIEALLCQGEAAIDADLRTEVGAALAPFTDRGLARWSDAALQILPSGLPYTRTIAALFDPYRQDSVRRFSSAV